MHNGKTMSLWWTKTTTFVSECPWWGIFFLDAPEGSCRTFAINHPVASFGIAATLLSEKSTFKLLLELYYNETPICYIKIGTNLAELLEEIRLIIWDECTMAHKRVFPALDKTLKDIKQNLQNMGSISVLLAGDFRQTLLVIAIRTPADETNACLKSFLHLDPCSKNHSWIWSRKIY